MFYFEWVIKMLFPNVAILLLGKTHIAGALLRRPSLWKWRAVVKSCWSLHKQQYPYAWRLAEHRSGERSRFIRVLNCAMDSPVIATLWLGSEWEIFALCENVDMWIPAVVTHEVSSQAWWWGTFACQEWGFVRSLTPIKKTKQPHTI